MKLQQLHSHLTSSINEMENMENREELKEQLKDEVRIYKVRQFFNLSIFSVKVGATWRPVQKACQLIAKKDRTRHPLKVGHF